MLDSECDLEMLGASSDSGGSSEVVFSSRATVVRVL